MAAPAPPLKRPAPYLKRKGYRAILIPVSHAFHTEIVAPASGPLREVLDRLHIYEPQLPLVANLTGDFYPAYP